MHLKAICKEKEAINWFIDVLLQAFSSHKYGPKFIQSTSLDKTHRVGSNPIKTWFELKAYPGLQKT